MNLMKIKLIIVITTALITMLSCSTEDDGIFFKEINQVTELKTKYSEIELEMFQLINNYRLDNGLKKT